MSTFNRPRPVAFKTLVSARYHEKCSSWGPTLTPEKLALDVYIVDHGGRNIAIGPDCKEVDFSRSQAFKLGESKTQEFRT
jgi:hypothetical protein